MKISVFGFEVWGFGFDLGHEAGALAVRLVVLLVQVFRLSGSWIQVSDFGFRVSGYYCLWFIAQGLGCWVIMVPCSLSIVKGFGLLLRVSGYHCLLFGVWGVP